MASWEPSPMEMGSMGRQKRGFGGCKFVVWGVLHELGFLPLYSFSDFRHPIKGCSKSGLSRPSGLGIRRILCLERSAENFLQLCLGRDFRLTPSSTRNVTIFKKEFSDRFQESPNSTPTRFPLVFLISRTHQRVKQEHCAILQLLIG